jgi:hypothetical protein
MTDGLSYGVDIVPYRAVIAAKMVIIAFPSWIPFEMNIMTISII